MGLNFQDVLRDVHDPSVHALKTTATLAKDTLPVSGATQAISVAIVDSSGDQITSFPVTGTFYQATQPISGTVTANAGTNLNTSTLALEAGGNLASVKTNTDNIPALGQALAASSVPIVLTAAQITTLTPPAAITGFATEAKQLPDGHNVTVDNVSLPVTGTFYQATQPVSIATMPSTPVTGTFWQATQPVSGTFYQATQPVSGTVTANLSATDNAVLDSIDTSTASHYITGVSTGRTVVTTAGTRVVLAASTPCKRVDICAETDNTGIIVVGGTAVVAALATRQGIPLNAGDVYSLEISNLNNVNLDSTVSGDGVTYTYYT